MQTSNVMKGMLAISSAALLAACGGGDSATAPEVVWASPAVFVTPGAASKSYALKGCERSVRNTRIDGPIVETVLYKATLVIASSGDMSISASTTDNGTPSVVFSRAFADAQNVGWSVQGSAQTFTYSINNRRDDNRNQFTNQLNIYEDTEGGEVFGYLDGEDLDSVTNLRTDINCDLAERLQLQVNANEARAAKNLGTAAGVTTFDSYEADGRIEGDNAFWYSRSGSPEFQHWRFNLKTGALASSSTSTGTYTTTSLALPTGTNEYGSYGESKSRNNSFFDYKEANSICLGRDSQSSGFSLSATAYGNKFYPSGDRINNNSQSTGFESPMGLRFYCGGQG